jgi:hypothetical protein
MNELLLGRRRILPVEDYVVDTQEADCTAGHLGGPDTVDSAEEFDIENLPEAGMAVPELAADFGIAVRSWEALGIAEVGSLGDIRLGAVDGMQLVVLVFAGKAQEKLSGGLDP